MVSNRRTAVIALICSGLLWGASVSLSKVALGWLDPAWLTVGRFLIAGIVLAWVGRRRLRAALSWRALLTGALGFGACVVLQNAGIARTSVSHASVLMGVVPALVAVASLAAGHGHASRREWLSYTLSLAGIAMIASGGGGGATAAGDLLVLLSVILSAGLIALQPGLLRGKDPAALTAVQFFGAAGFALPIALASGQLPAAPTSAGAPIAFAALTLGGTVLPFWLFAYGQARVRPQLAGAFVNLEPVIGAAIGWVLFANPVGPVELLGAVAVIAGIVLAATLRTLPVPGFAAQLWQSGVATHAALLARPWETDAALLTVDDGSVGGVGVGGVGVNGVGGGARADQPRGDGTGAWVSFLSGPYDPSGTKPSGVRRLDSAEWPLQGRYLPAEPDPFDFAALPEPELDPQL